MNTFKNMRILAAVVALALSAVSSSAMASQVVDVVSSSSFIRGTWANFGYQFTTNVPVRVDALGLLDWGANGLVDQHPVGLWDGNGTMLAQAIVDNASAASPAANPAHAWRYTDIAAIVLTPGTYKLGAFYPTNQDPFALNGPNDPGVMIFAPEVTYVQSYVTTGGTEFFTEPNTSTGFNPGFFGPNARFTAVPEPATLGLLMIGGAMMVRRRR